MVFVNSLKYGRMLHFPSYGRLLAAMNDCSSPALKDEPGRAAEETLGVGDPEAHQVDPRVVLEAEGERLAERLVVRDDPAHVPSPSRDDVPRNTPSKSASGSG